MAQSDKEALNLYKLIGAPLLAVVQAEAQAAQVSADFIKEVGFESPPPLPAGATPGTVASAQSLQDGGPLGNLKIASFGHKVRGIDGVTRDHTVSVPVLSLYPIPLLQIKDAEFDFAIKVLDHVSKGPELPDQAAGPTSQSANPGLKEFLSQNRVELKGAIAREHTPDSTQHSSEMQLKVKIRMQQADIPVGLMKLFNLMDQTIQSAPTPKPVADEEAQAAAAEPKPETDAK
jgi:hypothetical protein